MGKLAGVLLVIVGAIAIYFYLAFSGGIRYEPSAEDRKAAEAKDAERRAADEERQERQAAESERNSIRITRENHRADDGAREMIFKASITSAGRRCDSVRKALMTAPGQWTIECAPGHRYKLAFDEHGNPVQK